MERGFLYNCHNRAAYNRRKSAAIFQRFPIAGTQATMCSLSPQIFIQPMCPQMVLQSYRNLLRNGDETLSVKYITDLDIQWATKGSDVDFSKLPTDGFSTTLIPDDIDSKHFPGCKPVALPATGDGNCLYRFASMVTSWVFASSRCRRAGQYFFSKVNSLKDQIPKYPTVDSRGYFNCRDIQDTHFRFLL